MTAIIRSMHRVENGFSRGIEKVAFRHPYLTFLGLLIGVPMFIALAVALFAALFTLPIAAFISLF